MARRADMKSMDLSEENVKKLRTLFPGCVTETAEGGKVRLAVDFDALRAELTGAVMGDKQERYQFTWPDKIKAKSLAAERVSATLRPCREESVDFDKTQNLYIEGDNLDVLKLLLETYLGKVKMIYIDPPYNTGSDYLYRDTFLKNAGEYRAESGQYDDEGNRLVRNPESNGRYHTDWLNMIFPRLLLARDLLRDDGVIFISIDENELLNLAKVADEVFGYNNRIGILSIVNNLKGRSDDKFFATCNEFLLVYARDTEKLTVGGFRLDDEELENDYDKKDELGHYKLIGFRKTGNGWQRKDRPYMFYPVLVKDDAFDTVPEEEYERIYDEKTNAFDSDFCDSLTKKYTEAGYTVVWPQTEAGEWGRWRWGRETFLQQKDFNLELNASGTLCTKMRATFEDGSIRLKTAKTLWYRPEYDTGSSSRQLRNLFGGSVNYFDNPKSTALMKDMLKIATDPDSLVLDFFSGSATTAHAVMQLNAEDGGNRKFMMIQLPEPCPEESAAFHAGYKNICEIAKERLRRVGSRLRSMRNEAADCDFGFRVLKLDSSNMEPVFYVPRKLQQSMLDDAVDNVKTDRTPEDLLFQVMLDLGVPLSASVEEKSVGGKKYFAVNGNELLACFDDDIDNEILAQIAARRPAHAAFKDKSFSADSVGINAEQLFRAHSPATDLIVI